MLNFDLSMEELKSYHGTNPCPEDFDAYWERALGEMRQVDANVTVEPAKVQFPGAECFDLYFTGVGGSRIYAKYLRPQNRKKKVPLLLQFHGYTMNSGDWYEKLGAVSMGFAIAAMDCRGQGGKSEDLSARKGNTRLGHIIRGIDDDVDALLYRQIFLDCAQLAEILMGFEEIDENRVGALGGSQGGALTVACAALVPQIKRIAPFYPFLSDYQRAWEMGLESSAYMEIREYFRRFDPRHEREREFFTRLGYIDIQNLAKRINAEVLWTIGLEDQTCPPSTQFATYNKINAPKKMVIYPDYGHEYLPDYFDIAMQYLAALLD